MKVMDKELLIFMCNLIFNLYVIKLLYTNKVLVLLFRFFYTLVFKRLGSKSKKNLKKITYSAKMLLIDQKWQ